MVVPAETVHMQLPNYQPLSYLFCPDQSTFPVQTALNLSAAGHFRGTLLMRNCFLLGPFSRPMSRAL